jgi:multiple sugar transport system ATP-binding protein
MNLCAAHLNGDCVADEQRQSSSRPRERPPPPRAASMTVVGLRPGHRARPQRWNQARVEVVEELGADAFAFCVAELGGETETRLIARTDWRRPPERGDHVALVPRPGEAHVFDPATGERLGAQ